MIDFICNTTNWKNRALHCIKETFMEGSERIVVIFSWLYADVLQNKESVKSEWSSNWVLVFYHFYFFAPLLYS